MSDYNLIQPGRHRATCFEFEFPEPKPGKAHSIALGWRFSDGDADQGRIITSWHYFSDGALAFTLEALRAAGWRGEDPSEITLEDIGNEVELVIRHEEYEGKTRARVQFVNQLGGGMVKSEKRLEGNDLKKFGASMKAKIRALGGASPKHTTKKADPPAAGKDDDLPF